MGALESFSSRYCDGQADVMSRFQDKKDRMKDAIKIHLPEGWAMVGEGIFDRSEDDEDMWQAIRGDEVLDVGVYNRVYRCRFVRNRDWQQPVDEAQLHAPDAVVRWIYGWIERLK